MKNLYVFIFGVVIGFVPLATIWKINTDNMTHVACKMYDTLENKSDYQFVQRQFGC